MDIIEPLAATSTVKSPKRQKAAAAAALSCIEGKYCNAQTITIDDRFEKDVESCRAIVPCRCSSQWCSDCALGHAVKWREKLRPVVSGQWGDVCMITLTIDQSRWSSPEEAYLAISKKRSIWCFVQKLKRAGLIETGEFFYAVEFHKKGGWLHWHLAVRAKRVTTGRYGSEEWKRSKERIAAMWGHGWIEDRKTPKGMDANHAVNYLTKYIVKQDVGPPDWVLDRHGNFRKFSTSRGLCPVQKRERSTGKTGRTRTPRTPRQVVARCAQAVKVLEVVRTTVKTFGKTFEPTKRYRYVGKFEVPFRSIDAARFKAFGVVRPKAPEASRDERRDDRSEHETRGNRLIASVIQTASDLLRSVSGEVCGVAIPAD